MSRIRIPKIRLPLFMRVVALYAFLGVPMWLGLYQIQPTTNVVSAAPIVVTEPTVKFEKSTRISGEPRDIELRRLGVSLAVIDGEYDRALDSWTLSDDKVQFARMTDIPNNESGNTFMYGHNTDAVFAPLSLLQPGDEAIIHTTNGLEFRYLYNGNQIVNPDATSILAPTETPSLTLMTCEGIFSEARRVAVFDFEKVL